MEFNSMGFKLITGRYQHIFLIKKNIDNGKKIKTLTIEHIDFKLIHLKKYIILKKLNLVHKEITYCFELPCGILIEKMCIISSDVKINKYKLLSVNTLRLSDSFKKLGILHYFGFFKHLTKVDSDFVDTYHELKVYKPIQYYENKVKQLIELSA